MNIRRLFGRVLAFCLLAVAGATLLRVDGSRADEGMWTLDNPPLHQLQERYGFTPTPAWLDHIRLSSVRFNDGGSGSFVSPHGLVLTNHHVALGQLQKVSSAKKDYVADGFYAPTRADELKCPDLELNLLVSMEEVTRRVQGSVKSDMSDEAALRARKAEIAKIEKESTDSTGLRSDVITLYAGGEYWVYRYKKYTDIRLVFAPERQIAFFGGDPDNFTYPRYDIDFALFRVYENEKPVESKDYLKWNRAGAAEGELVFVSGHPGSTARLDTLAQIETERDYGLPLTLKILGNRLDVARRYSERGPEQARQALNLIFGLENSLKAYRGMAQGLADKGLIAKKQKDEADFRAQVASQSKSQELYGGAWDAIAQAEAKERPVLRTHRLRTLGGYRLPNLALTLVRLVTETKKPDGVRLDGYHEAQLESLRFRLFSPAPIYPQFEEAMLAGTLGFAREGLGPDDPFIQAVLNGRSPEEVAKEVVAGTKLADAAFRKSLVEGGEAAVQASTDPLIVLARQSDPFGREVIKWHEDNVQSVEMKAGEKIGQARFAAYGKSLYPDATFTLRLAFGAVKGYPMNGTIAPVRTTFYGLYDRAYGFDLKPPFDLPRRFLDRRSSLDLSTPVDFISACDIIGGNSGSPVVNKQGELVGLIFDGNIEGLVGDYVYNEENNRAVAVHSAAMIEVLRKVYDAGALADELTGK
ncbi:MAG: S46 family peptidase [Terriglobia bacterium]